MITTKFEDVSVNFPSFKNNVNELNEVLQDMKKELDADTTIVGLSAPMVQHYYRIIALRFKDAARSFINPLYVKRDNLVISREKFFKDNQEYLVPRFKEITIMFTKTNGTVEQATFKDSVAFMFQQMYDTLDAITLENYGLPIDDDFDELTKEEQDEICKQYLENLKQLNSDLKEEIYNDEYLRGQQRAIDFMESVAKGETKLANQEMPQNRAQRRQAKRQAKKIAKQIRI